MRVDVDVVGVGAEGEFAQRLVGGAENGSSVRVEHGFVTRSEVGALALPQLDATSAVRAEQGARNELPVLARDLHGQVSIEHDDAIDP